MKNLLCLILWILLAALDCFGQGVPPALVGASRVVAAAGGGGGGGPYEITSGTNDTWGTGTWCDGDLWNTYYYDRRGQFIILASEMTAAGMTSGNITGIALRTYELPGVDVANFYVRMQSTSATTQTTAVTSGWSTNYGPATITTASLAAGDWRVITFDTAFSWNGTSNVLVDLIARDAGTSPAGGGLHVRSGGLENRGYRNWGDNTAAYPFDTNQYEGAADWIPSIKFYQ